MKIKNISNKVITVGEVVVLPGESAVIPPAFESCPVLEVYKDLGFAEISGRPATKEKKVETTVNDADEALRQARLASLDGITDEALAALANELGINPADCKDQADVMKKVRAALKK